MQCDNLERVVGMKENFSTTLGPCVDERAAPLGRAEGWQLCMGGLYLSPGSALEESSPDGQVLGTDLHNDDIAEPLPSGNTGS